MIAHSHRLPAALLIGIAVCGAALFWLAPPLPQEPAYHLFADRRAWCGVPNCNDVVSNAALLLAGIAGLIVLWRRGAARIEPGARAGPERALYALFFAAVCLTGIGSAYYHGSPDTARLFWDRLPLSLLVGVVTAILIAERAAVTRGGIWLLAAWLLLAPLSVIYWIYTEAHGAGDLRAYWLTQAFPVAAAIGVLALLPPRYSHAGHYGWALACYGLARVFELLDRPLFDLSGFISGHTLKHLAGAVAVAVLARMLARRRPVARL